MKTRIIIILIVAIIIATGVVLTIIMKQQGPVEKKPAIYLYPTQDMQVTVKVKVNGEIIKDIPAYNDDWNVFTTTNSLIENQYDYLFYEARLTPTEGWVVASTKLKAWFNEYLPQLGLNEKEKAQFEEYWLPELPSTDYIEIKILSDAFLQENMELIISPNPDTQIRLNFLFTPLNQQKTLTAPTIITPRRIGFTVVEWGGIVNNNMITL